MAMKTKWDKLEKQDPTSSKIKHEVTLRAKYNIVKQILHSEKKA